MISWGLVTTNVLAMRSGRRDEEKLNTSEYIFQLNLKKIDYKDIIGLEEAFEFKKRLCNYK